MTPLLPRIRTPLLARAAVAGLLLAGCAATASSEEHAAPAGPPRVAIIAGPDASASEVAQASRGTRAEVRRAGGTLEAQAQAAALAARGYDVVIGVGPQARAAVGQARSAEIGAATRWQTTR